MTVADSIALAGVRALSLALPEATEKEAWGSPTFRVGGKIFAHPTGGGARPELRFPAPPGAQELLVQSQPERYFLPPYVHHRGWIGMWMDGEGFDWGQVAEGLVGAYELCAPKRLLKAVAGQIPSVAALARAAAEAANAAAAMSDAGAEAEHSALVEAAFVQLRAICARLPEAEIVGDRFPAIEVRGKSFANVVDNHHGDGRFALWCKAPPGAQGMLVDIAPERYFVPPYVGHNGWIGAHLDGEPSWDEIAGLLEDAWRMSVPKRMLAQLP